MYCYVWEYEVRPERLREFRRGYGPAGEWVEFFRRHSGYLRTELLCDRRDATRFLTIDYWDSREACMEFRERFQPEFEALDRHFDAWTVRETCLGEFDIV